MLDWLARKVFLKTYGMLENQRQTIRFLHDKVWTLERENAAILNRLSKLEDDVRWLNADRTLKKAIAYTKETDNGKPARD